MIHANNVERVGLTTLNEESKLYQQQPCDSTLKSLLEDQAKEIIPFLVEGAEHEQELSGEALKPPLRADRVFLVRYQEKQHILYIELETGPDSEIAYRLLEYYGILLKKHKKPIISAVLYPFRTSIPESPLRVMNGADEILIFHFRVIAFWKLEAQDYLNKYAVSMYALLPTMYAIDITVLSQALDEMKEYYTGRERKLATQLLWFGTFLQRTDTVSPKDKRRIEEKMDQFDSLLEQNPYVQKKSAEAEEKGEVKALQRSVVNIIRRRFPALTDLAQLQVTQINKPDVLDYPIEQVSTAPDEAMVRQLLHPTAA
jgi:hypothetical protein